MTNKKKQQKKKPPLFSGTFILSFFITLPNIPAMNDHSPPLSLSLSPTVKNTRPYEPTIP